jgi:hypothetical protein
MFLFRGGQAVEKGTYWEPDAGKKIVLTDDGSLPGDKSRGYFKLPESYLLVPVLLLGLGLSMAFPYGIGAALCALLYVLYKTLRFTCRILLREGEKAEMSGTSERNEKENKG